MTTKTAASTPLEWLNSLGNSLNEFYEAQCKAFKAKKGAVNHKVPNSAVKKVPSTTQKPTVSVNYRSNIRIVFIVFRKKEDQVWLILHRLKENHPPQIQF